MPVRNDRDAWTPDEDAWLRDHAERGVPVPKQAKLWPDRFPRRTLAALRMRRANLGIVTNANAELPQKGVKQPEPDQPLQSVEVKQHGDELTVITNGLEVRTLDELVARAKVDLSVWEVDKPQTRMWEVKVKDAQGKIRNAQNFYIAASFKRKHGPNVKEQVEALIAGAFATTKQVSRPIKVLRDKKIDDGLMQAVVIADPHLAKYAWGEETGGADYDLDIASRLVDNAARDLMDWGDERKPAVRYLLGLGDLLHYDNPQGHTTSGTPQDRDTRMAKMLKRASEVLVGLVLRSAETSSTKVVLVPGNHDRATTYAMQLILANRFHNDPRVTVDLDPKARKYIEWGACLLGLTHGDTARKRLLHLMQVEQKEAWGRSKVREWHHGHLHSEASTITDGGITIRQHLSLSPPDSWHSLEGYVGAPRGMDTYLYHKDGYLQGTWRSAVLDG